MMNRSGKKSFVLVPQYFGSLVFDRSSSRYMPFDHRATEVLKSAIETPMHQIISEIEVSQQAELIDFYESLCRIHFFDTNDRFYATALNLTPPEGHLAGPLAVHLEVIGACNLTCKHCFAGTLPRNNNPLSVSEMESLFEELAAIGSYRLGLTGGEPLMRKDVFDILDSATDHGLHPCLTTNGLLIDEKIAKEFGRRESVWLNVSLEGASAESNDSVRGVGVFDEVVEKLKLLRQHAKFTLAFTLTSMNTHEAEHCAQFAHQTGASSAVFRPLYPVGVAASYPELMPEYSQYIEALRQLGSIELGKEQIWNQSEGFVGMRAWSKNSDCGACGDSEFSGGCRARAQFYNGHANAADPWHQQWRDGLVQLHPQSNWEMQRD